MLSHESNISKVTAYCMSNGYIVQEKVRGLHLIDWGEASKSYQMREM